MFYLTDLLHLSGHRYTLRRIEPSDIGIVTPYAKQSKILSQRCKSMDLNDITIGTAEIFQGKEKPVMIISTVRSNQRSLGFVADIRVI